MEEKICDNELHKKLGIEYFNATWDLIDIKDRTPEQDLEMIHKAHASCHHWSFVGTTTNFARGEWQVSRVYCLVGLGESALYHAKKSLHLCLENNIGDFDLCFGYEACARAFKVLNQKEEMEKHIALARTAAEAIAKEDDKTYFLSELDSI